MPWHPLSSPPHLPWRCPGGPGLQPQPAFLLDFGAPSPTLLNSKHSPFPGEARPGSGVKLSWAAQRPDALVTVPLQLSAPWDSCHLPSPSPQTCFGGWGGEQDRSGHHTQKAGPHTAEGPAPALTPTVSRGGRGSGTKAPTTTGPRSISAQGCGTSLVTVNFHGACVPPKPRWALKQTSLSQDRSKQPALMGRSPSCRPASSPAEPLPHPVPVPGPWLAASWRGSASPFPGCSVT